MKISQSLIKNYFRYLAGNECGLQLKAKYFDGVVFPETEAFLKGKYLEYLCTGSPDRNGKIPVAPALKSDPNTVKAAFRVLQQQAENFKRLVKRRGIEIIEVNFQLSYDGYEGLADMLVEQEDQLIWVDIKSTGYLYDKWEDFGWEESSLQYKPHLLMQSLHYPWLGWKQLGDVYPFEYWVFDTKKGIEFETFRVEYEDGALEYWERKLSTLREQLQLQQTMGWDALPDVKRCAECPLKFTCPSFTDIPKLKTIHINLQDI